MKLARSLVASFAALCAIAPFQRSPHAQVTEALLPNATTVISLRGTRLIDGKNVYELVGNQWTYQSSITAHAALFAGYPIAQAGERLLAGSSAGAGYAFVLRHEADAWLPEGKLTAPDAVATDLFASALALGDEWAALGAPQDDDVGVNTGLVRMYRRSGTTWTLAQTLYAPDAVNGDAFGSSVSIDGARLVVGARSKANHGSAAGGAYVFEHDGTAWALTAVLSASDPDPVDFFGWSLELHGARVLIGAPGDDEAGTGAGAAYVFEKSAQGWVQAAKLMTPDTGFGASLGASVSLGSDMACAGAYSAKPHGQLSGSAYLFGRVDGQWKLLGQVLPRQPAPFAQFGKAVALDGDHVAVYGGGKLLVSFVGQAGKSLQGFPAQLSLSHGGTQALGVNVGTNGLEHPYIVLGSFSGTTPGVPLPGGLLLPLVDDAYFAHTLNAPNQAPLEESFGVLGSTGQAECYFTLPAQGGPALFGATVHHAALVLNPVTYAFEIASNAVPVQIVH